MIVAAQHPPLTAAAASRHPRVEIRDGLVYKHGEPQTLAMEAMRTGLAARVGERSGRFVVPKLRELDVPGQTLVTEYIPHLLDLHQIASQGPEGQAEVFRAAGRALATVHRELQLPADQIVPLPEGLLGEREDEVALHGDFCCSNVGYQRSTGQIVLLDWATAPLLGTNANYGARYFDLVWFAWSLFFWTPRWGVLRWRPERLMRALGEGYAEVENRFRWQRYVQYRRVMRWLPKQYWKGKRAVVPSDPYDTCAQLLGWLRWRLFPWGGELHSADGLE